MSDSEWCDRDFSDDEFFDAVMMLKNNKVPGHDGLTAEFYHAFWKELSPHLIATYRFSYNTGILPISVCKGLILLLAKKSKDPCYIKNMRPLTLLNTDYKILAKAIDNRISTLLPSIICGDQTGFVKGHKIAHNTRKTLDIIDHTKLKNIPALILSIDMEKCFDRLEHESIFGSMQYFNFGEKIIKRSCFILSSLFVGKHGKICDWLYYQSLLHALHVWKFHLNNANLINTYVPKWTHFAGLEKVSREIYRDMITSKSTVVKCCGIWNQKAGLAVDIPSF